MTELAPHQPPATDLQQQMTYAETVSRAGMLPDHYRGKPADILLAIGLGQAMGLSPAESLMRINVIKGKPTASAELIASNVRRAGHKLRIRVNEQLQSVTAQIVRADDPDYVFEVTRDPAWAEQMGLARNDNYKRQPLTMLQWRAITAVARQACPEALYGVQYAPDELGDMPRTVDAVSSSVTAADFTTQPDRGEPAKPSKAQLDKMFAMLRECGCADRSSALAYVNDVLQLDEPVTTRAQLTADQVSTVLDELDTEIQRQAAQADDDAHQTDLLAGEGDDA